MKARKIFLLILILAFGGSLETAWSVRHNFDIGPFGCRVLGGKFYGNSFSFDEERRVQTGPEPQVELANAFGSVSVEVGEPGEVVIALGKLVYLDTQEQARAFAAGIELRAQQDGPRLRLSTNRDEIEARDSRVGFETRFRLRVPPGSSVKVVNEHGPVSVADVAAAEVENGFDSVELRRVAGPARLVSRHGRVNVSEIRGDLELRSRHGDVEVLDVEGRAELDLQHGDVTAKRTGELSLALEHGDFTAEDVRGDLSVQGAHAGVSARDVAGAARVKTSYRGVSLLAVGADASVESQHGDVRAEAVRGGFTGQAAFGDVTLAGVDGAVDVTVEHGGVRASGLRAGAKLRGSGQDIEVTGFRGPLEVRASRGGVRLIPDGAMTDSVSAESSFGDLRLEVPDGSRFELVAEARSGGVSANVVGLAATESGATRVVGRVGSGGALVKLVANHGDVELAPLGRSADTRD